MNVKFDPVLNKLRESDVGVDNATHTGDATGDTALTIAPKAVTLAKMSDMATASLLGRKTALTGVPEVLSKADVLTLLNVADGANAYVHPNHSGDATSVADGAVTVVKINGVAYNGDPLVQYPLLIGRSGGQTIKGGTTVTDILKLQGTSGNGTLTSPAIQALVGNNGATVAYTILNNGNFGFGITAPTAKVHIVGNADTQQLIVKGNATQTANLIEIQNSSATVLSFFNSLGAYKGRTINSYLNLTGEAFNDTGMTGIMDRNDISNAALKGVVTLAITGAGVFTNSVSNLNNLFDGGAGTSVYITGIDATTSKIVVSIDMRSPLANYYNANWLPFVLYRFTNHPTVGWARKITVEMSNDNVNWYKPVSGQWETADINVNNPYAPYWFGVRAGNTIVDPRYIRFTLEEIQRGTGGAGTTLEINQLGFRHVSAPYTKTYALTAGDTFYGDIKVVTPGTATQVVNLSSAAGGVGYFVGGNFGFGITGATAKVHIVGNADTQQLIVKGHSTQTSNLQEWQNSSATVVGSMTNLGAFKVAAGFGCNTKTAQAAYASGGALSAYSTGAYGLDSDANMTALYNLVVAMRAALVANGILS